MPETKVFREILEERRVRSSPALVPYQNKKQREAEASR
ncbi:hypothetical protein [Methylomonas fluvii]|nr:hypothetical protein [Methylomonas fluvii]